MRTNDATGIATLEIQRITDGVYRPTDYHLAKVMSWGAHRLASTCMGSPVVIAGLDGNERASNYKALGERLDETIEFFDGEVPDTDVLSFHIDQDGLPFALDAMTFARGGGYNNPVLAGDFHPSDIEEKMRSVSELIAARNVHADVAAVQAAA